MSSAVRYAALVSLLAAIYLTVGRAGLAMDAVSGFATLVWPPSGIALAALLLAGIRLWPGVWLGAFAVNVWAGAPWIAAAGIATGNTFEALAGAYVLRTLLHFDPSLRRVRDAALLIGVAAFGATCLSATIGVLMLVSSGIVSWSEAASAWRAWWIGDAIGILVVAPLILTWAAHARRPRPSFVEVLALSIALACAAFVVLGGRTSLHPAFQQPYVLFPISMWSAVRFGARGAATSTFAVCAIAIAATVLGVGPFVQSSLAESLLYLQVFMAMVAGTFLTMGAFSAELEDRKSATEAALRSTSEAREEAERASALKTNLLSVVSHELRTPLAALRLQLERLKLDEPQDSGRAQLMLRMHAQTDRLNELIEGLLTYASIKSGRLDSRSMPFDLGALVKRCAEDARPLAEAKHLSIALDVDDAMPAFSSDAEHVHMIVINLLANAIKFTERGTISIRARLEDGRCEIAVTDTGPGVGAEDRERIFEPFEQIEPMRTKHLAGVGIGLALAKELAIALGGTIALRSELGRGSTFTLELPAMEDES